MKYLLIVAHADPKQESTTYQLCFATKKALEEAGHEIKVVDLIREGFKENTSPDDFLDIGTGKFNVSALQKRENLIPALQIQQDNVTWAENVIVFSPIWFFTLPACFWSYLQRVYTAGWGYVVGQPRDKQTLLGRRIMFVLCAGAGIETYSHLGRLHSMEAVLYPITYTFNYMGFDCKRSIAIYSTFSLKPEVLEARKKVVINAALNIVDRENLPFNIKHENMDGVEVFARLADYD